MADLGNFNAAEVEPNVGFDPIPAGEYDAVIVSSAKEPTKSGNGSFLKLELQILTGQFQNRKLWDRLNLDNPNQKAVQIARGTLSAICRAVGVLTPKDSSELHNKPLKIKVAIEKSEEFGDRNAIKSYAGKASAAPVAAAASGRPWN